LRERLVDIVALNESTPSLPELNDLILTVQQLEFDNQARLHFGLPLVDSRLSLR